MDKSEILDFEKHKEKTNLEIMVSNQNDNIKREIAITPLQKESYKKLIEKTPPQIYFGDKFSMFICGNQYRKLRGSNGNWIKNVEELFGELIFYIMDQGEQDEYVYLFMEDSAIGRESKNGHAWQKLKEEEKWRIITFNRMLYNKHVKEKNKKLEEKNQEFFQSPGNEQITQEIPEKHPLNDKLLLANIHRELGKRIVKEERNRLIVFIGLCSAYLLSKPLGCAGLGKSSVGKSMVFETVINHFPEIMPNIDSGKKTGWFLCNNIKEAALFRLDQDFADHTIFYLGEMPDSMTETQKELYGYLRQLQSEGRIAKTLSEPTNQENGRLAWKAVSYYLKANISFFALSVFEFEEQFGNRQIKLSFDESEAQTNRIADWKTEIQMYSTTRPEIYERTTKSKYIIDLVEGLDKWFFKHYEIVDYENPYADHVNNILKKLYSGSIQLRRVTDYVFKFIEVITRLHSKHRTYGYKTTGCGGYKIVATSEDNLIGLYLLWNSLEQAILDITQPDKEILKLMKDAMNDSGRVKLVKNQEWEEGEWFTANQMAKTIGKGTTSVREACRRLAKVGYIKVKKGDKSGRWWKYNLEKADSPLNSVGPSDFLPFFLPVGVTCYLSLDMLKNLTYSGGCHTFFEMPILASIFNEPLLKYCTDLLSVYIYYRYITTGGLENSNQENNTTIEEILLAYESKKCTTPTTIDQISEHLEIQEGVLRKWVAEIASADGSTEFSGEYSNLRNEESKFEGNSPIKEKTSLQSKIKKIILNWYGDNINSDNHISTIEIKTGINKHRKKKLSTEEIRKELKNLCYNGFIYEPTPDLWSLIQ